MIPGVERLLSLADMVLKGVAILAGAEVSDCVCLASCAAIECQKLGQMTTLRFSLDQAWQVVVNARDETLFRKSDFSNALTNAINRTGFGRNTMRKRRHQRESSKAAREASH